MRPDDDDLRSSPAAAERPVHRDPADPAHLLVQPASSGISPSAAAAANAADAPSRRRFLKTVLIASAATAGAAGAAGAVLSNGALPLQPLRLVSAAVSGACTNQNPTVALLISAPPSAHVGDLCTFSVSAVDAFGDLSCYTGTVHFTSSDPSASLLHRDYTYTLGDAGVHVFFVTFGPPPGTTQTITVTDTVNSSLTATSDPIIVIP